MTPVQRDPVGYLYCHSLICKCAILIIPLVLTVFVYQDLVYPLLVNDFQEKVSQLNFTISSVSVVGVGGETFVSASLHTPLIKNPLPFQVSQIRCNFVPLASCGDIQMCYEIIRIHYPSTPFYRMGYIYWPELCEGITIGGVAPVYKPISSYLVFALIGIINLLLLYIISRFKYCKRHLCPFFCFIPDSSQINPLNIVTVRPVVVSVQQPSLLEEILRSSQIEYRKIPDDEDTTCVITMEPINGLYAHCEKCHHNFDLQSFIQWWDVNKTCPTCRTRIMINPSSSAVIYTNQQQSSRQTGTQVHTPPD